MKKIYSIILCFIFSMTLFAGCANDVQYPVQCEHSYIITTINPTCANQGYDLHTCEKCYDTYRDNYIEKTKNHSGVGHCSVCGINYFNELKNYMVENANYVQTSNYYGWTETASPFDILWTYKPNQNRVEVSFTKTTSSVILFFITYYDNSNGHYNWGMNYKVVSSNTSYQMEGTINAQTLTDSTYYLSYTASTFPNSMISDAQHLAATNYRSNVGFFQSVLDMYDSKSSYWGYTNLSLGGLLP